MPIYEYQCLKCKKRFSVFCKIQEREESPPCEHCASAQSQRLVSRFKTVRSEDQLLESMADPTKLSGLDENDPRSIARWAKKMAKEMGEDMGDEIEQMAEEELAKGEDAFKDMPGGPSGNMGGPGMGMPPGPMPGDDSGDL